ncbi:hypothetical protein [Acinetobacter nosocomialis]|uniref:hypothetical protein n=1 Tax=Acinetobacter nosocomialis TaxID=106654 RepID=UPI001A9B4BC4|nr:hypothetical protein [Acinetobacter nosocomialis]MBO1280088.1 hypothetical protein [Acinetobacter nosocomialis]
MDIVALKQDIIELERYRDEKNVLISNINMDNYEGEAKKFRQKDLIQWNKDVADLNERILELKREIHEIENEHN